MSSAGTEDSLEKGQGLGPGAVGGKVKPHVQCLDIGGNPKEGGALGAEQTKDKAVYSVRDSQEVK